MPSFRPSRRLLWLAAGLLVLLACALLLGARPFVEWRAEHRLSERIGPVTSLSLSGSPLELLRGHGDRAVVDFAHGSLPGDGGGEAGALLDGDRFDEVEVRADRFDVRGVTLDALHLTSRDGAFSAGMVLPPQTMRLAGRALQMTPSARDGVLELELGREGGQRLPALRVENGTDGPRLTIGASGIGRTLGGGLDGVRIDDVRATEQDGRVVLSVHGLAER